ncbi:Crp/Fnr family transcriptional regulator [uncultured Sphingomonas sp.]|uniref:Crp/Fnr family transcriptional regulator n=1 Tax=uncultured Sphingomonas sp. TaxID=158754 RepID=UPI0035CB249C
MNPEAAGGQSGYQSPSSDGEPPHLASALRGTRFDELTFLSAEDRRALAQISTALRSFSAGVDLVTEGVRTDHIYFLTQGWACRYKTTRQGARQITGLAVPGDVCNLDSFMRAEVNFGVRSLTAVTVAKLPRDRVQALAAERPGVARAFTWLSIMENSILSERALSIGRKSARERLAHFLCELSTRLGSAVGNEAVFLLPITQEQIADVLGLTSVHVNRTMRSLRAEGLIAGAGRQVTVPDMAMLSRVGGFDGSYLHAIPLLWAN